MRNYKGLQSKLEQIAKYGCYLLSIASHFNYQGDLIELYDKALIEGWITTDCTVLKPNKIAEYLAPKDKWDVTKTEIEPIGLGDKDFYIECWYNPRTGYTHFKLPDSDTLRNSVTVKEGKIVSYRLFTYKGAR